MPCAADEQVSLVPDHTTERPATTNVVGNTVDTLVKLDIASGLAAHKTAEVWATAQDQGGVVKGYATRC